MNPRLRLAVNNAKAESMPKDNIDRAIKKGQGGDAESYDEIRYEGFGPGGVGVIVEVLTDNRNRAAANVRSLFSKNGGNLGETGSVSFMFDRVGRSPSRGGRQRGRGDGGGDRGGGGGRRVGPGAARPLRARARACRSTPLEDLQAVADALTPKLGEPKSTAVVWRPKVADPVAGDAAGTLVKLVDALRTRTTSRTSTPTPTSTPRTSNASPASAPITLDLGAWTPHRGDPRSSTPLLRRGLSAHCVTTPERRIMSRIVAIG
jgi:hypothetical protein